MAAEPKTEREKILAAAADMRRSMPPPVIQNITVTEELWNDMIQDPEIEIPAHVRVQVVPTLADLTANPDVMSPDFV
jgi:hypothetical protein